MRRGVITGWGKCVPPAVLSNADLETVTETSDDWITTRTGIKERRISHVEVSELAAVAAERAMAAAGVGPSDLDMVILATCTPDRLIPSAAAALQERIGALGIPALDINAACSGFVYSITVADQMIRTGAMGRILVAGAEKLSSWLDFTRRDTAVLFGDGAGAVILEASEEDAGILAFDLGADGSAGHLLCVPNTGTAPPSDERGLPYISMEGADVFRRAVTAMGDASTSVIEKAGLSLDEVDLLIPHQANVRIIDATARRLGLDPAQVYVNIASYGNTSAATIPIALTEALEDGKVQPGSNIVFAAFGGGFTWGAVLYRWGSRTEPIGTSDAALPASDATALQLLQRNIDLYGKGI